MILIQLFILLSIIYGYSISVLLFFRSSHIKKSNRYLSLFILCITNLLLWVIVLDTELDKSIPYLLYLPINILLGIGPFFYFYVRSLLNKKFVQHYHSLFHFIPMLCELTVHFFIVNESLTGNIDITSTKHFQTYLPYIQIVGIISLVAYSIASYRLVNDKKKRINKHYSLKKGWINKIIYSFISLSIIWLIYTFIDIVYFSFQMNIQDYYPLYISISFFLCWLTIYTVLNPDISINKMNVKNIALSEKETKTIKTFEELLKNEKPYLDPDLRIDDIAKILDVHSSYFSNLVKYHYKLTFTKLISKKRVEYFIDLIDDPSKKSYSIFGLATDSGFKSKASFNRIFKDLMNTTPKEFILNKKS